MVDELVQILVDRFGYIRAKERPSKRKGNGQAADEADRTGAPADWQFLIDNILAGRDLHASLRDLAAKMIKSGMHAGAAVNALRAMMDAAQIPHDARWNERRAEIPRLVKSAEDLIAPPPAPTPHPMPLAAVHELFRKWLGQDYDLDVRSNQAMPTGIGRASARLRLAAYCLHGRAGAVRRRDC